MLLSEQVVHGQSGLLGSDLTIQPVAATTAIGRSLVPVEAILRCMKVQHKVREGDLPRFLVL